MITLLISPIARRFKLGQLVKVRRLIGLYSFFWAAIHLLVYLALDLGFDASLLASEIATRPYLTIGALSWVILLVLAITSTQGMQRRLGHRWQKKYTIGSTLRYCWHRYITIGRLNPVLPSLCYI